MIIERRSFLIGLSAFISAPAVVRAASLMPVSAKILMPPRIEASWNIPTAAFMDSNTMIEWLDHHPNANRKMIQNMQSLFGRLPANRQFMAKLLSAEQELKR